VDAVALAAAVLLATKKLLQAQQDKRQKQEAVRGCQGRGCRSHREGASLACNCC
jgi:hypothetical protein